MAYSAPTVKRLRVAEVAARLGIDRVTLWKWVRDERFPPGHCLVGNRRAWFLHEVEAWERQHMRPPEAA